MSDSENDDIFERLATSKYATQANLSDEETVPKNKPKPTKAKHTRVVVADDDLDLEDLAAEVGAVDTARIAELRKEIQKWEAVLHKAQTQKVDKARVAKVLKKIKELQDELAKMQPTTSHAQDLEIQKLERDIQALESEQLALNQKITAKIARLDELRPHLARADFLNDPSQLGGRIVDGKFIEDVDEGEDDYQQLAQMMSDRRRAAQSSGQYNSESGHVKIKNPKQTTDDNAGF